MIKNTYFVWFILCLVVAGCQTASNKKNVPFKESNKDVANAISNVADVLAGQPLTDEQKRKFTKDIQKDKDTQSALRSIAGAMDVKQAVVKYCPVDGQRYSADLQICPVHKIKLKELVD